VVTWLYASEVVEELSVRENEPSSAGAFKSGDRPLAAFMIGSSDQRQRFAGQMAANSISTAFSYTPETASPSHIISTRVARIDGGGR
jgi:hypothetical protein